MGVSCCIQGSFYDRRFRPCTCGCQLILEYFNSNERVSPLYVWVSVLQNFSVVFFGSFALVRVSVSLNLWQKNLNCLFRHCTCGCQEIWWDLRTTPKVSPLYVWVSVWNVKSPVDVKGFALVRVGVRWLKNKSIEFLEFRPRACRC